MERKVNEIHSIVNNPDITNELKTECITKVDSVNSLLRESLNSFIARNLQSHLNNNSPIEVLKEVNTECISAFGKISNTAEELRKLSEYLLQEIFLQKNNFNFDLTNLYSYLDTLELNELSALFHILVLLVLLINEIDILTAYFSKF